MWSHWTVDRISRQNISFLYLTPNWIWWRMAVLVQFKLKKKFMHILIVENIKGDLHSCCDLWIALEVPVKTEYISVFLKLIICLLFVSTDKCSKASIYHSRPLPLVPQFKIMLQSWSANKPANKWNGKKMKTNNFLYGNGKRIPANYCRIHNHWCFYLRLMTFGK